LQREVDVLSSLRENPSRPYVAVLGGAKVSDKLETISALVEIVDTLIIGGAMAFTMLAAAGAEVGKSLCEPDRFEDVRAATSLASARGIRIVLPVDAVVAAGMSADAPVSTVPAGEIPADLMGLDVGPDSVDEFKSALAGAKTILWNGPMGVFELEPFANGTRGVAEAIADKREAFSVVGGGDSLRAVSELGLEKAFSHLSTGGGASLEFLEGRELPGIRVLEEN
jgi:phosphoglycerate kinase